MNMDSMLPFGKRGFVAFYALTVLFILTFIAYGVDFANATKNTSIQFSMVESQARQALDAGMAIALRIASSTQDITASFSFDLESGPCEKFSIQIEASSGTISLATVTAVLYDFGGFEFARRRGNVLIQTVGQGAKRFAGGWKTDRN